MSAIPRLVHRIWLGPSVPSRLLEWSQTDQVGFPEWSHRLWRDAELESIELPRYFSGKLGQTSLWQECNSAAQRADIARLLLLEMHGGVYLDADIEIRQDIRTLFSAGCVLISEQHWVANGVMAAPPDHWLIRRANEEIWTALEIGSNAAAETGPGFITQLIAKENAHLATDVRILPSFVFRTDSRTPRKTNSKWDSLTLAEDGVSILASAIHHYDDSWRSPLRRYLARLKRRLLSGW